MNAALTRQTVPHNQLRRLSLGRGAVVARGGGGCDGRCRPPSWTYIDPFAARTLLELRLPQEELTARELEVLRLIALGRQNKEIAGLLHIGEETVKSHAANVFGKLQVQSRAQAVVQALKRGLVALEELD